MKYTTAAIAAATVALGSATTCAVPPSTGPVVPGDIFKIIALPETTPNFLDCKPIQAVRRNLLIGTADQGANCTAGAEQNYASFVVNGQGLVFLYTGAPPESTFDFQQLYVDRSGMGQGNIQYTTGPNQTIGRNQQYGPFKLTEQSELVFNSNNMPVGFQACPLFDGDNSKGWKVWIADVAEPAHSKGCVKFTALAVKEEAPLACEYSFV
ncbi:hypothetical protein ACET3X_006373 [Alternaria dauci]|uniref:Cell wall protein PhiA n=1 Tax=Alternaria dauci TaxID=48095 RepID=A0ABR3UDH1_9PLEO